MPHLRLPRALGLSLLALAALVAAAVPAAATSYVMVSDADLADQAAVVAEGRIVSVAPSPAGGSPSIDYLFEIDRLLKGYTAGSSIVVRVLGGMPEDGRFGLAIFGAPTYREGDRALLFLTERPDGSYQVLHFLLGAFHEIATSAGSMAIRNLADATQWRLAPAGAASPQPGVDHPRDAARFASWLADRGRGVVRAPDYFVQLKAGELENIRGQFNLFVDNGMNLRWPSFGSGITFFADQHGQDGLAGGGFAEYQNVLRQWTGAVGSPIHYVYGGTTTATGGLVNFDNVNTILFNDPNHELTSAFNCSTGGLLAISGPWFDPSVTTRFNGRTLIAIQGADTITNAGIACFFQRSGSPSKAAEELFGHEVGHTLGLGHSCGDAATGSCTDAVKNDALMRAFIHDDGRGMRLGADDVAGVRFLYGPTVKAGACRSSSTALCLGRRFLVTLSWLNQFDGSSGVGRAIPRTAVTGFFSFGDPNNVELLVKILDFGTVNKLFYGELTNLQFTLTVTDTETGDVKTYGNTPGDCGGIDQSAFAGSSAGSVAAASAAAGAPASGRGGLLAFPRAALRSPAGGRCRGDRNTLCLLNGRFSVTVDWSNPGNGEGGAAVAAPLSNLVGTFYFDDPSNVELMTKLIAFPDRIAFFYGALSDLPYTIHVTDNSTGTTKDYASTAGKLCGGLDDHAF
jgi:hypothetical protein